MGVTLFSIAVPSHDHTGLRLYRLPKQFHLKGTLLCANRVLYKASTKANMRTTQADISLLGSLA
jgi:hypothetical protein